MEKGKNKLRIIIYTVSGIISVLLIYIIYAGLQEEKKNRQYLIAEIQNFVLYNNGDSSLSIEIIPYQLSNKEFIYKIDNPTNIKYFIDAVKNADEKSVSGHSGPIYECTIIIKSDGEQLKYLATVHKYEKDDLFISNTFYRKVSEVSYTKGPENRIRLPGIGQWIMNIAPKGIL